MDSDPIQKISRVGGEIAKKSLYAGATRGAGAIPRVAAEAALNVALADAAQRAANRYKKDDDPEQDPESGDEKTKKLTGVFFFLVLALAGIKDLLDVIGDITLIFSVVSLITGPVISFVILFYLFMNNVSLDSRKLVTFIVTTIIGLIPFLNLLPETMLNLILIRIFENSELAKKGVMKAVSKYT